MYSVFATIKGRDNRWYLEKFAPNKQSGAGFCFFDGMADVSWEYKQKAAAIRLGKSIRSRMKKIKKRVKVEIYDETSEHQVRF